MSEEYYSKNSTLEYKFDHDENLTLRSNTGTIAAMIQDPWLRDADRGGDVEVEEKEEEEEEEEKEEDDRMDMD